MRELAHVWLRTLKDFRVNGMGQLRLTEVQQPSLFSHA